MEIKKIDFDKKRYLDLLLLADEKEEMIDRYLQKGEMFVLFDDEVKAECVVLDMGEGVLEIKNIATYPEFQKMGYARELINFLLMNFKSKFKTLQVGTGDSPATIPFYKKCGFEVFGKIENFFIENYDKPIFEGGKQLVDMIYLKKEF